MGWMWIAALLFSGLLLIVLFTVNSGNLISYGQFLELAEKGQFEKVTIRGESKLIGKLKKDAELPDEIKSKVKGGIVEANILAPDKQKVVERFPDRKILQGEDEPLPWLGPFFVFVFPASCPLHVAANSRGVL